MGEHSRRGTRWVHFAGTHAGLALALAGRLRRRRSLIGLAPVVAYGAAWTSHFLIEHNRPATFGHPLWSLRGDIRMLVTMWRGRDGDLGRMAQENLAARRPAEGRKPSRAA